MVLLETSFLGDAVVHVELDEDLRYSLRYSDLVSYSNGVRTIQGKTSPYRFRSVEQLRYDFEQDVIAVGGRLA